MQIPVWLPPALLAGRRRREGDRRRRAGDLHLDPAHVGTHRDVDDLLEAEGSDVEVDGAVGVGDGDAHAADLREIELGRGGGHLWAPPGVE